MSVLIAVGAALAAAVLGRIRGAWKGLEQGRHCPMCGRKSLPVAHHGAMRYLARSVVRRWCPGCGWEGLRRRRSRAVEPTPAGAAGFRWAPPPEDDRPLLWKDGDGKGEDGSR